MDLTEDVAAWILKWAVWPHLMMIPLQSCAPVDTLHLLPWTPALQFVNQRQLLMMVRWPSGLANLGTLQRRMVLRERVRPLNFRSDLSLLHFSRQLVVDLLQ